MPELDLPKFVHLTLDESVPAPVAERLARTSYSPAELVVRRKRLRRVFSSVLLGAGGLILIAGIVAAVGAYRSSSPARPAAADQSSSMAPAENGEQPIQPTVDEATAANPAAAPTASPKAAPVPARKVGMKAKKPPIVAHAPF